MSLSTFIHSVGSFFEKENPTAAVSHSTLASTRLWVTIGFGAALIWLAKGVLTQDTLLMLTITANTYLVCNTVSRVVQLKVEGDLKKNAPKTP